MFKNLTLILVIALFIIGIGKKSFSYERNSRLHSLNEFNVKKNTYRLLRTKKCSGCYLVNAKLSRVDLRNADLRNANLIGATFIKSTLLGANLQGAKTAGANFSGAVWVDGSLCQQGSIGTCLRKQTPEE